MLIRLGNVVYWGCNALCGILALLAFKDGGWGIALVLMVILQAFGRAVRYIVNG